MISFLVIAMFSFLKQTRGSHETGGCASGIAFDLVLRHYRADIDDHARIRFSQYRTNAAYYWLRTAIIEDLPKPVKNACDALPSAVLSGNAKEAAAVRNN
jgi:hypothetical protein